MAILTRGYNTNQVNIHTVLHRNGTGIAAQMPNKEKKKTFLILHYKYNKYREDSSIQGRNNLKTMMLINIIEWTKKKNIFVISGRNKSICILCMLSQPEKSMETTNDCENTGKKRRKRHVMWTITTTVAVPTLTIEQKQQERIKMKYCHNVHLLFLTVLLSFWLFIAIGGKCDSIRRINITCRIANGIGPCWSVMLLTIKLERKKNLVVIRSKTNTTGTHTLCINGFCDTCSTWLYNINQW